MAKNLREMRRGKATVLYVMTVELLKCLGEKVQEWVIKLFKMYMKRENSSNIG